MVIRDVGVVKTVNQWKSSERGSCLSQKPTSLPVVVGEVSNSFSPGPKPSCTRKRHEFACGVASMSPCEGLCRLLG